MNLTGTRFLINVFRQEVFIPDLKKIIAFNFEKAERNEVEVVPLSEDDFDRSVDIKKCIAAGMLMDVTKQVLAEQQRVSEQVTEQPQYVESNEIQTKPATVAKSHGVNRTIKGSENFLVEDWETSRALSGSDREERLANISKKTRPGASTGVLVSEYNTPEEEAKAARVRGSFLIKEESRAKPTFDPRLTGELKNAPQAQQINSVPQMVLNLSGGPLQIQIPEEAFQKKNQYLNKAVQYTANSDKPNSAPVNNPLWWQNSSMATERMIRQTAERQMKKAEINREKNDPRLTSPSRSVPNALLTQALIEEDPDFGQQDEQFNVNPLLRDFNKPKTTKAPTKKTATKTKTAKTENVEKVKVDKNPLLSSLGLSAPSNLAAQAPSLSIGDILNKPKETNRGSSKSKGTKTRKSNKT